MENLNFFDIGSIKLGVKVAREHSINLLVGQFARTLDDTLPNPCLVVRNSTSMSVDLENHTDCESILAGK
jgi:hypothetical protein